MNPACSIVIVEDDPEIVRLTTMLLELEGYRCQGVDNGLAAVAAVREAQPDLVILDVMLPGQSGIEVCRQLREFYQGGILMLTGRDDDITELSSFRHGADDYVTKPLKPHLLLARIEALLRRTRPMAAPLLRIGGLQIDSRQRTLRVGDSPLDLSDAEFELIELLARHAGQILSREQCCKELRGLDYDGFDRSIDMRISTLRKKLTACPEAAARIVTVRGRGYMLTDA